MGVLTATIGGQPATIFLGDSVNIDDKINARSTASFSVLDTSGAIRENQLVVINDSVLGRQFEGVIDTISPEWLPDNSQKLSLACKDNHFRGDKIVYTGPEMTGRKAGDVVTQLQGDYLAAEGVTAQYALDHDMSASTWGAGIHSNTIGNDAGLQLAPAGVVYSVKEDTTTEFNTGVLTGVTATGNTLQLNTAKAIKLSCSVTSSFSTNCYVYVRIYNFSGRVVTSGDKFYYDMWIDSRCPDIMGGIDFVCTDGTTARDNNTLDQYQLSTHPKQTLNTLANGQWFHRECGMPDALVGKTLAYCSIAQEGDRDGDYSIWVKNVTYRNSAGTVLNTIYGGASSITPTLLGRQGVESWSCSVVNTYEASGTRVSPSYQNTVCTVLQQSLIAWEADATEGQVAVETSFDNGYTYQSATNHEAIPNLIAGMSVNNKYFKLRETLKVNGPSPEVTPKLKVCMFSLTPSYSATKADVIDSDLTGDASMGTGSLTKLSNITAGLGVTGTYRNWNDGTWDGATGYTSVGGTVAGLSNTNKSFGLRTSGSGDGKARFDFAGQHQNFTLDIDICKHNATGIYGVVYRTTGWQNGNDTYCYFAGIQANSVVLGHGTNVSSGAGGWTQVLVNNAVTIETDKTYHMRLVVNGTSHKVYIDDILELDATDSFYTSTGYIGVRYFNPDAGVRLSSFFDNFGVVDDVALSGGNRVWPSTSISAAGVLEGSCIQWNSLIQDETALDIQASTDGGASYASCTNNAPIPGCAAGANVTGKSLLLKAVFTSQTAAQTARLLGLTWFVVSDYQATGTRTSAAMSMAAIENVGSTSLAWVEDEPANTTVTGKTSIDNSTYTTLTSGSEIAGLSDTQDVLYEDFAANNSASWVSSNYAGGAGATYTWDTTNSRLTIANGTDATYIWGTTGYQNGVLNAILYCSETGSLLSRFTDDSNHYRLRICDSAASTDPNTLSLIRRVGGVNTTLDTWAIYFPHNSYHVLRWEIKGAIHALTFDGALLASYTDTSPYAVSGKTGIYNSGGSSIWQSIASQGYGTLVTALSGYMRFILTSSDPMKTPTVSDATLSARGVHLITGATMPSTGFGYKNITSCIDDAAKQSNGWWMIDENRELWLQNKISVFAPWVVTYPDLQYAPVPRLTQSSPAYRNKQYVRGAFDTITIVEQKSGTGYVQSWALSGRVQSINTLTVGTRVVSFGVDGVDTGKEYYYKVGEITLSQDKSYAPLDEGEVLSIDYVAQVDYTAMAEDTAQQAIIAALDGTSGKIEQSEEAPADCDRATADAIAAARIAQFCILSKQWGFSTLRNGLEVGQWVTVFVPQYSLNDADFLITAIRKTFTMKADLSSLISYDVACTNGPPLKNWTRYFTNMFNS